MAGINLGGRDVAIADTDIPVNEKSAFRAIGKDGQADLMRSGIARNNQQGMFADQPLYASKGSPLRRYVDGRAAGDAILEFEPSANSTSEFTSKKNHVREVDLPNRYTDKVRVWEKTGPGEYKVSYDNFNPVKRAARTVGAEVVAPAALMAVPEAVAKGMTRLAGSNKPTSAEDFVADLGSALTAGAISDAGDVPEFKYGDEGQWTPSRTKAEREEFARQFREQTK